MFTYYITKRGRRGRSWLYGIWIYYYLSNQCLSPPTMWVRIPPMRSVLDKA